MIKSIELDRRALLLGAASAGLACAGTALADSPLEAAAERQGGSVTLTWTGSRQPASIFVSASPDAPASQMRRLSTGVSGGKAEFQLPIEPRPYLLVRTPNGQQTRVAERALPLQGGRNFRDLGGYRTADGRQVVWGRLYRSGVMSNLTAADLDYLHGLGLNTICDLRSAEERAVAPSPFRDGKGPAYLSRDYGARAAGRMRPQPVTTVEAYVDQNASGYIGMATATLVPNLTDMFEKLVNGDAPLAFNCTAGRDRTGVTSAIILSLLDVPRATVLADYALTGVYLPKAEIRKIIEGGSNGGMSPEDVQTMLNYPPDVLDLIYRTDPIVMKVTLQRIDAQFGGPTEMAKKLYGLDDQKIAVLRRRYVI